jgi:hypothetical protein
MPAAMPARVGLGFARSLTLSPGRCVRIRSSLRRAASSCRALTEQRSRLNDPPFGDIAATIKIPQYSNCLIFALTLWMKWGGYLIVRKSRAGPFPHFLWCADLAHAKVLHFSPRKVAPWWYRPIHMLWFKGVVKDDDM